MSIKSYYKEVVGEMKKVVWPSRSHTIIATVVVILISVLMSIYLFGADEIFKFLLAILVKK